MCVLGWLACGHARVPPAVVRAAASLEMFHAFALVHDDVMDGSATRRGRPSVHRAAAARHAGRADADQLGASAAILIGDLALVWSDELLHTAGLPPERLAAALRVVDTMRTEVMQGQYMDLFSTGKPTTDVDHALVIARYKTAKYTVERPLHIGAALAGADPAVMEALSAFALPTGEAFQLRDDLLGAFGDPAVTGKSECEDLQDAKHTVLMALALRSSGPGDRHGLRALLYRAGQEGADIGALRAAVEASGARAAVEDMIEDRRGQALRAWAHP